MRRLRTTSRYATLALAAAGLIAVSAPARAATTFTAVLTGAQEVPPVATQASGVATFVLNDAMTALTFSGTFFGLDLGNAQTPGNVNDNLVAAHIHAPGAPGVNGPVVFGFFGTPFNDNNPNDAVTTAFASGVGGTFSSKWDAPEGNLTTLAAQLANILAGNSYINLHTTQFLGGEIRGQIQVVPEPGTLLLLGSGAVGVAAAWRRRRRG